MPLTIGTYTDADQRKVDVVGIANENSDWVTYVLYYDPDNGMIFALQEDQFERTFISTPCDSLVRALPEIEDYYRHYSGRTYGLHCIVPRESDLQQRYAVYRCQASGKLYLRSWAQFEQKFRKLDGAGRPLQFN